MVFATVILLVLWLLLPLSSRFWLFSPWFQLFCFGLSHSLNCTLFADLGIASAIANEVWTCPCCCAGSVFIFSWVPTLWLLNCFWGLRVKFEFPLPSNATTSWSANDSSFCLLPLLFFAGSFSSACVAKETHFRSSHRTAVTVFHLVCFLSHIFYPSKNYHYKNRSHTLSYSLCIPFSNFCKSYSAAYSSMVDVASDVPGAWKY